MTVYLQYYSGYYICVGCVIVTAGMLDDVLSHGDGEDEVKLDTHFVTCTALHCSFSHHCPFRRLRLGEGKKTAQGHMDS